MKITPYRLQMAKRCLTAHNVVVIDDNGLQSTYAIHADLFGRYVVRQAHKFYAKTVKRRKQQMNKRDRK